MKTIVVIESNGDLFRRINNSYAPQGYNVVYCSTMLDALSVPASEISFLAIYPRALDEEEATSYIESLKMRNPACRVLLCVAHDYDSMTDALNAGADDYIVGPFDDNTLENHIKGMLA